MSGQIGISQITKIISGGQTGVDRGALDAAIFLNVEHGGWCPRGRRAEDGVIAEIYKLRETNEFEYSVRTERNVRESDGTLILSQGHLTGGTLLTAQVAKQWSRPCLIIDFHSGFESNFAKFRHWIQDDNVRVMNVAGPRESGCPGIAVQASEFLIQALNPSLSGGPINSNIE